MSTLYLVIGLLAGCVTSVLLLGFILKPLKKNERSFMNILVSIVCIAVLLAVGIAVYMFSMIIAIGYVVGVLLAFVPFFKTSADIEKEKALKE